MLVNKLGRDVLLLMLYSLRFCKSFRSYNCLLYMTLASHMYVASFPHMYKVQQIISQCHSIRSLCNFASREISLSSLRRIKNS